MNSDINAMSVEESVIKLKREHKQTWRDKPDWFWLLGLLEEVWELALALVGLHRHSPEVELRQISAIAMNWLEKRETHLSTRCSGTEKHGPLN